MFITISHIEGRKDAGFSWRVQVQDPHVPALHGHAPTLADLHQMLDDLLYSPARKPPAPAPHSAHSAPPPP